jgi:phosphatidylglycerol:prolipoprotein diacylglycerol transferase
MHPILFRIPLPFHPGHFDIASYGAMVAIGSLFGVLVAAVRAKRSGEKAENLLDLSLWVLIAGLIGARVFFLLFYMDWTGKSRSFFSVLNEFFKFRQGGLVFYGGLLLAIPVGILFLRVKKLNLWKFADIAAPSVPLGIAFARIGCYLNGCCWGKPCSVEFPFHVAFPKGSFAADFYGRADLPLYPTQFISSIAALLIFLALSIFYYRRKYDGQVFWLFVGIYAVTRFAIEFLRGDSPKIFLHTFTISQTVSLFLLPLALTMLILLGRKAKRTARAAPPTSATSSPSAA